MTNKKNIIRINVWKAPKGVSLKAWHSIVVNIFCRNYGLLEKGRETIYHAIEELYKDNKIDKNSLSSKVPRVSQSINFISIYDKLHNLCKNAKNEVNKNTYKHLLSKLKVFEREDAKEYKVYGSALGISINELIESNEILELDDIDDTFCKFLLDVISFYQIAKESELM